MELKEPLSSLTRTWIVPGLMGAGKGRGRCGGRGRGYFRLEHYAKKANGWLSVGFDLRSENLFSASVPSSISCRPLPLGTMG